MGKRLGDAVFDGAEEELDFSKITLTNAYIVFDNDQSHNPKNKDKWGSNSNYKGKFVPIPARIRGWRYKVIAPLVTNGSSSWYQARWAFLLSDDHTTGAELDLATGEGYSRVAAGGASERVKEGVIPSDAEYLYIYCYNSGYTPQNFLPEFFVYNPNPTSRIERLEDLTEGVEDIKEGWFAISGEPYQLKIKKNEVGLGQTIAGAANNMGQYMPSAVTMCLPKVPFDPPSSNFQAYHPSASECFCVDNLPDKVLHLKFNLTPGSSGRWAMYIALYDSSLNCYSRMDEGEGLISVSESDNWEKDVFDFKNEPQCKYFKLLLFYQTNSQTSDNAGNVPLVDDFLEITQQVPAQDSMPDRVEALEEKVSQVGSRKFTFLSYNIGHFSLGKDTDTFISDQKADYDYDHYFEHSVTPFSNYAAQRMRWRQMLNEYNPDIIACCEYIATFSKNGENRSTLVPTKDAIFGRWPYYREGSIVSPWTQMAVFANIPLGQKSEGSFPSEYTVINKYYLYMDINICGVTAKVVVAHLDWGDKEGMEPGTCRTQQIQTLLAAFANESHVIICGDFNNASANEWDAFANAGYTMANHGYLGDMFTYPSTGTEIWANGEIPSQEPEPTAPRSAIDNIIVKGFAISNVRTIDRCDLTDHMGVVCDLTLVD